MELVFYCWQYQVQNHPQDTRQADAAESQDLHPAQTGNEDEGYDDELGKGNRN